jgi:hypothetical protein
MATAVGYSQGSRKPRTYKDLDTLPILITSLLPLFHFSKITKPPLARFASQAIQPIVQAGIQPKSQWLGGGQIQFSGLPMV